MPNVLLAQLQSSPMDCAITAAIWLLALLAVVYYIIRSEREYKQDQWRQSTSWQSDVVGNSKPWSE